MGEQARYLQIMINVTKEIKRVLWLRITGRHSLRVIRESLLEDVGHQT